MKAFLLLTDDCFRIDYIQQPRKYHAVIIADSLEEAEDFFTPRGRKASRLTAIIPQRAAEAQRKIERHILASLLFGGGYASAVVTRSSLSKLGIPSLTKVAEDDSGYTSNTISIFLKEIPLLLADETLLRKHRS
jgi:hypothetical protein